MDLVGQYAQLTLDGDSFDRCLANFLDEFYAAPNVEVLGLASLTEPCDFKPGDRVKTLRGSMSGKILRVVSDGRVVW